MMEIVLAATKDTASTAWTAVWWACEMGETEAAGLLYWWGVVSVWSLVVERVEMRGYETEAVKAVIWINVLGMVAGRVKAARLSRLALRGWGHESVGRGGQRGWGSWHRSWGGWGARASKLGGAPEFMGWGEKNWRRGSDRGVIGKVLGPRLG